MIRRGFTLVEILVVVAIVLLLLMMTIPQILRAQITSNEAGAIGNLRTFFTSSLMYYNANNKAYPADVSQLSGYLNEGLVNGSKSGYLYVYTYENSAQFHVHANPQRHRVTGEKYFYIDEGNRITFNLTQEADENDPVFAN